MTVAYVVAVFRARNRDLNLYESMIFSFGNRDYNK